MTAKFPAEEFATVHLQARQDLVHTVAAPPRVRIWLHAFRQVRTSSWTTLQVRQLVEVPPRIGSIRLPSYFHNNPMEFKGITLDFPHFARNLRRAIIVQQGVSLSTDRALKKVTKSAGN